MDKCGIYKITNLVNNKIYVGQSRFINARWRKHRSEALNGNNLPIYKAIRKYGIDNFKFEIIEECAPDKLNEREAYYIYTLNTLSPNGYNLRLPSEEGWYVHVPDYIYEIYDDLKNTDLTYEEIAQKYGISASHVFAINYGKAWRIMDTKYPINKKYGEWDTTQVVPLLKQGLKTKEIAQKLGTTQRAVESYMSMQHIHTSDYRKRLTSNRKVKRSLNNEEKIYDSIKQAGLELSTELNLDENTALCGIKRALKGNGKYKNYYWQYIDNRNDEENE